MKCREKRAQRFHELIKQELLTVSKKSPNKIDIKSVKGSFTRKTLTVGHACSFNLLQAHEQFFLGRRVPLSCCSFFDFIFIFYFLV